MKTIVFIIFIRIVESTIKHLIPPVIHIDLTFNHTTIHTGIISINDAYPNPLYRLRIIGPNIIMARPIGKTLYLFEIFSPGQYVAEVPLLHKNYSFIIPTVNFTSIQVAKIAFSIPLFQGGPLSFKSHWVFNCTHDLELISTCLYPAITGRNCLSRHHSCIKWTGDFKDLDTQNCILNKHVCIVGDSQARFLASSINHKFKKETYCLSSRNKSFICSENVVYIDDNYFEMMDIRAYQNCSHIIANFGNWPLSFMGRAPWTPLLYKERLEASIKSLKALNDKNIVWFLSPAFPLRTTESWTWGGSTQFDWRNDFTLQIYNDISKQVMLEAKIPIIDLWSPSYPLTDLSIDGAHYSHAPLVDVFVNLAIKSLC